MKVRIDLEQQRYHFFTKSQKVGRVARQFFRSFHKEKRSMARAKAHTFLPDKKTIWRQWWFPAKVPK
jgi:hypothetical protein